MVDGVAAEDLTVQDEGGAGGERPVRHPDGHPGDRVPAVFQQLRDQHGGGEAGPADDGCPLDGAVPHHFRGRSGGAQPEQPGHGRDLQAGVAALQQAAHRVSGAAGQDEVEIRASVKRFSITPVPLRAPDPIRSLRH
ncbi:hypothetical protein ACWGH2_44235 [Streptomyces sp. NPDC054871]